MNFGLPKNERLHSKKSIKELFNKGSSFFLYPFKVLWLDYPSGHSETNQVLFSVSKKKIKKAVYRNHIKRRIKEAYRLNKHLLECNAENKKMIAFVYVSSDIPDFQDVASKIQKILLKFQGPDKPEQSQKHVKKP